MPPLSRVPRAAPINPRQIGLNRAAGDAQLSKGVLLCRVDFLTVSTVCTGSGVRSDDNCNHDPRKRLTVFMHLYDTKDEAIGKQVEKLA